MPTARRQSITLTTSQMVALFLSRRVFDFLAGTGFKEDLDDVFEKLEATLKRKDFAAVRNLDRKVFDVNEARHLYEGRIEDVNDIMTALLREERLRVTHEGVSGGRKTFVLEPYTLLVYKKGLYLAGFSHQHREIRTFALDGFREVEWLRGRPVRVPAGLPPGAAHRGRVRLDPGRAHARPDPVRLEGRPLRPAPAVAPDAAIPRGRRRGRDDDGGAGDRGGGELGAWVCRTGDGLGSRVPSRGRSRALISWSRSVSFMTTPRPPIVRAGGSSSYRAKPGRARRPNAFDVV